MAGMDSDEDNLPPALSECYSPEKLFKSDDIIWAKHKKYYWPAVIKTVHQRKKKLSVMYIDSPNHTGISVSFSRAISFNSVEGMKLKKQNVEPPDLANLFEKTLKTVEDYLCKRILSDKRLSPIKFFTFPLQLANEDSQSHSHSTSSLETQKKKAGELSSDESSEENDLIDEESQEYLAKDIDPREAEIDNDLEEQHKAQEVENDSLLKLMFSKPCSNHLLKILKGKLICDRHRKFISRTPSVRRQLKLEAGFGPIYDRKEFSDLIASLLALLKKSTAGTHFDVRCYLFDVWIPEALTWALGKHHKISLTKARKLFSEIFN